MEYKFLGTNILFHQAKELEIFIDRTQSRVEPGSDVTMWLHAETSAYDTLSVDVVFVDSELQVRRAKSYIGCKAHIVWTVSGEE
jgi:hypothetical protein